MCGCLAIRNAKAGQDVHLPITPEIAFAFSYAINAEVNPHHEVTETDYRWPPRRRSVAKLCGTPIPILRLI
jgi:hypothetical protein